MPGSSRAAPGLTHSQQSDPAPAHTAGVSRRPPARQRWQWQQTPPGQVRPAPAGAGLQVQHQNRDSASCQLAETDCVCEVEPKAHNAYKHTSRARAVLAAGRCTGSPVGAALTGVSCTCPACVDVLQWCLHCRCSCLLPQQLPQACCCSMPYRPHRAQHITAQLVSQPLKRPATRLHTVPLTHRRNMAGHKKCQSLQLLQAG